MKKILMAVGVYVGAMALAFVFYKLPDWTGNAWRWDRLFSAITLALVFVMFASRLESTE